MIARAKRRSALDLFNFYVAQWFFVRLQRTAATETDERGNIRVGGTVRWDIIGWIWPLTGWWSDYRFIGSEKELKTWKPRKKESSLRGSRAR